WLFANKAHVSFPAPSVDTLSVLSNEITVGKLDQFLASLRSPLQMDASFNTVFASLSEFSQYQYPFYEQKGLLRVGDPIENKSTLV
ncbi:hypothetical protein OFC55_36855, partial [Escherichia coli]|nr:hypothetical protein [Escherichia coli]